MVGSKDVRDSFFRGTHVAEKKNPMGHLRKRQGESWWTEVEHFRPNLYNHHIFLLLFALTTFPHSEEIFPNTKNGAAS